jgi:hypothetical protein
MIVHEMLMWLISLVGVAFFLITFSLVLIDGDDMLLVCLMVLVYTCCSLHGVIDSVSIVFL